MSADLEARFRDLALADPDNRAILARLPELGLADCWLVAGCLFGAVWNTLCGAPSGAHVRDYDIFYWDADTSWEAEDRVIRAARALFAGLDAPPEPRNQARVPLWFEARFGSSWPPGGGPQENIARFVVAGTCLGIAPDGRVCAPFGFDDLFAGLLRRNPRNPTPQHFEAKCASYRARWPWLRVIDEEDRLDEQEARP